MAREFASQNRKKSLLGDVIGSQNVQQLRGARLQVKVSKIHCFAAFLEVKMCENFRAAVARRETRLQVKTVKTFNA